MKPLAIPLDSLVDTFEAPSVVIDKAYKVVAANAAYCAAYSVQPGAVIGRHCYEISHRATVPCHENGECCPHAEVFATRAPFEVLHTHFDAAGAADHVRIKARPLTDADGNVYLLEGIHRLAPPVTLDCEDMQMVGRTPVFLECLEHLALAARTEAPVLLHGETGTGKELAARHIHQQSARRAGPYIELNCAAIPEGLTESELFGHERGAFTGCSGMKRGLFEQANSGTLFLDEIGELPLTIQAKFLRVLDAGTFRRVGGHQVLSSNVRIIAATNQDLLTLVADGRFREDLYFRIAGIEINLPPLRERREDIPALAQALVQRYCGDRKRRCRLTRDALERLKNHDYPGNVRELRNILQKATMLAMDGVIRAEHIRLGSARRARYRAPLSRTQISGATGGGHSLTEIESRYIGELLQEHRGHRRTVASILGISERTLYRKLNRYQLR